MPFEPAATFVTDVPGRLDRMPWSAFHWRVTIALGITWVLDGLEVTLAGTAGGRAGPESRAASRRHRGRSCRQRLSLGRGGGRDPVRPPRGPLRAEAPL